jgi:hypothetical protein
MQALPIIGTASDAISTGAGLANLYYQNKWARKQNALAQKRFEMEQEQYAKEMSEYEDEKRRKLQAQHLADLFSNASWLGDKNQERLTQNYGYYLNNLRK